MAYRRRQGVSRASTFKEEIHGHGSPSLLKENSDENVTNGGPSHPPLLLSSSYSFTPTSSSSSSLAAQAIKASASHRDPSLSFAFNNSSLAPEREHHRSKSLHSFNTFTLSARVQEGRMIAESKLKGCSPKDSNEASWQQSAQTVENPQSIHETTQSISRRKVAMATAAKAKLLLRELKTVKADLAFAKSRCSQLEEENKLLRDKEGREKGQNRADDDLIRLQLETLLAEKARLASENEVYSRENRFLREIVEYHQLTMQDVVYLDEGMEEVAELYPMSLDSDGVPWVLSMSSPHSPLAGRAMQTTKSILSMPQHKQQREDEALLAPGISTSISEDQHAK